MSHRDKQRQEPGSIILGLLFACSVLKFYNYKLGASPASIVLRSTPIPQFLGTGAATDMRRHVERPVTSGSKCLRCGRLHASVYSHTAQRRSVSEWVARLATAAAAGTAHAAWSPLSSRAGRARVVLARL